MPDIVCTCIYEADIEKHLSNWSTILDFVFSDIISVYGVIVKDN